jgi:hypothetical protein
MTALIVILLVSAAYYLGVYVERIKWKHEEHRLNQGVPVKLIRDSGGKYRWEIF